MSNQVSIHSRSIRLALVFGCVLALCQASAFAHAFLDHAEPAVGSQVKAAPKEVKIWFTKEIDAAASGVQVLDSDGNQIDKKDAHIDDKDKTLMVVSVPALAAGKYKVVWHVVAPDTHKTHGDFEFEVKP